MEELARIGAIVLAAGFSRRLGRPKQLLVLAGETLMTRAARVARDAGLTPVLVVVNAVLFAAARDQVAALEAFGCIVLVNEEAAEGMASSIRRGIGALETGEVGGVVLMTCDQVAVTERHLRALCSEPMTTAASGYAKKFGVPAYFPASRFPELQALRGDEGARKLLREARVVPTEALVLDVDTEEDLARAEAWLRANAG